MNQGQKHIGPTGVGRPGPGLDEVAKEHLRTIASSVAPSTEDIEEFIKFVDSSASLYWAGKSVQDENLPARVRGELKRALDTALRLNDRVNDLGGTSRWLLYSDRDDSSFNAFHESLRHVVMQLNAALITARTMRRTGGAPKAWARTVLAARVAYSIRRHLKSPSTTTPGGVFEQALATVVEAVEGRKEPAVTSLMRAALKLKVIEHEGGSIEIVPTGG